MRRLECAIEMPQYNREQLQTQMREIRVSTESKCIFMLLQIAFSGFRACKQRDIDIFHECFLQDCSHCVKLCHIHSPRVPFEKFYKCKRNVRQKKKRVKPCRYIEHDRSPKADNQITPGILPYCRVILLVLQTFIATFAYLKFHIV